MTLAGIVILNSVKDLLYNEPLQAPTTINPLADKRTFPFLRRIGSTVTALSLHDKTRATDQREGKEFKL
jgi:hypothetical protein